MQLQSSSRTNGFRGEVARQGALRPALRSSPSAVLMAALGVTALGLAAMAIASCSSEGGCDSNQQCPSDQLCILGSCQSPSTGDSLNADGFGGDSTGDADAAEEDTAPDAGSPDGTDTSDEGGSDTPTPVDAADDAGDDVAEPGDADATSDGGAEDAEDGVEEDAADASFDIAVPDTTPPTIVSISPADAEEGVAVPFLVTIEFDEAIRKETVAPETIYIIDVLDGEKKISGQPVLSEDQMTVTMAPFLNTVKAARPYRVRVETIVQDVGGNKLAQALDVTFYTAPPAQAEYENLAKLAAPIARQALGADPHFDYPTRFDFDGDLVSANNPDTLANQQSIKPAVYWDAVESLSHVFLTYTFLYPLRLVEEGATPVINDTAGVVIVYQKYPSLAPIAVYTYGRKGTSQDLFAFAVSGGFLDDRPLTTGEGTLEALFEDGAFAAYLTTPRHQACPWGTSGPSDCQLNAGILLELSLLTLSFGDGTASALKKANGTWPGDGAEASYELIPSIHAWWTKRHLTGDEGMWGTTFDYQPQPSRPGDGLDDLPLAFYAPVGQSGGRPPWAWRWAPAGVGQSINLPDGTFFLDPAFFLAKRHTLEALAFDPSTKAGWSLDYCFHPYQGIDQRGKNADCPVLSVQ